MKKLTIEEKAKAYDDAIEKARKLYNSKETSAEVMIACENIFPVLEEIENEKIKQEIIKFVQFYYGASLAYKHTISKDDMLAWLEKQGAPKSAKWSEKDEQHVDSLLKRLEGLCRNEFARTRFAVNEDMDWLKSLKERY